MTESGQTLRDVFDSAETQRHDLEHAASRASTSYQESLDRVLHLYKQCLEIADRISLFSVNEGLEDVATTDLRYLALNYHLGELRMNQSSSHRKTTVLQARDDYVRYLKQLDNYDILTNDNSRLLEAYNESPDTFTTAPTKDPAARRDQKIKRFREEKALKEKLAHFERHPVAADSDDDAYRQVQLTQLSFYTFQTFQALESIAQELHILSLAPPEQPLNITQDDRERSRANGYSERLDQPPMSAGMRGPLLDSHGKPLRPFTLFGSKREELRNGVFRPDHSLPTMSIDEYLEEERKRGGIIEGGGPQSGIKPQVDEDDIENADRETMKARVWDEYVEANPRGSGNTLNRG